MRQARTISVMYVVRCNERLMGDLPISFVLDGDEVRRSSVAGCRPARAGSNFCWDSVASGRSNGDSSDRHAFQEFAFADDHDVFIASSSRT